MFFIPTPTSPEAARAATAFPVAPSSSKFANVGKLILLRNGEHEANVDRSVYCSTPDWKIGLTKKGTEQSYAAGLDIARRTNGDPVFVYFSPYLRSYQTMQAMLSAGQREYVPSDTNKNKATSGGSPAPSAQPLGRLGTLGSPCPPSDHSASPPLPAFECASASGPDAPAPFNIIGVREDSRLRDGDIGRYEGGVDELNKCLDERHAYGSFFYRFPHGESGADVCDRVCSFLDAFQREQMHFPPKTNVVLVTHGLTIRMFVKRWFHLNVSTFHDMTSPPPGTPIELEYRADDSLSARDDGAAGGCGNYRFRLTDESVRALSLPKSLTDANGYAYRHKRLFGSLSVGAPFV